MFRQTTFDEFKVAAQGQTKAAVIQEFPCDDITPIHAFMALNAKDGACLLESAVKEQDVGRYSLLAIEPFAQFKSDKGAAPFEQLRKAVQSQRLPSNPHYPPMVGGAIGFMAYDAIRLFEKIPDGHEDQFSIPDLFFLFHTVHIAFDHVKGTIFISVVKELSENLEQDYQEALEKIRSLLNILKGPLKNTEAPARTAFELKEDTSDAEFHEMVLKAKEHIRKGDAFQIVLSRTFSAAYPGDPFEVYRALRMTNPSPFMFFMQTKDFAIAGSSPERLLKLEKGKMQTMPIAGSRPRNGENDEQLIEELLQDPKETAEHMMLVDLGRNDLGVVAEIGSVQVKDLKKVRLFPHVMHIVSLVEAKLAKGFDEFDALKAVFPAGTLSGAPKIRAMEIIDALEKSRRGIYGGAICTIDNEGTLDSCIAIRTAFIKNGTAHVRAGAGIVYDSDPVKESEETRAKAKGVLKAVQFAMEGVL